MSSLRHFQEIFLRNDRNILVLKCEKHSPRINSGKTLNIPDEWNVIHKGTVSLSRALEISR